MTKPIELILIRGLPGSGKTTLAKKILHSASGTLYWAEADHFFDVMPGSRPRRQAGSDNVYQFDPRFLGAAHDQCYATAMSAIFNGRDCVVSNTFSTKREIERYTNGVARSGRKVTVRVLKVTGEHENVHGVPKGAIQRMKDRWEDWPGELVYGQDVEAA